MEGEVECSEYGCEQDDHVRRETYGQGRDHHAARREPALERLSRSALVGYPCFFVGAGNVDPLAVDGPHAPLTTDEPAADGAVFWRFLRWCGHDPSTC
jgi:hypothetical protein